MDSGYNTLALTNSAPARNDGERDGERNGNGERDGEIKGEPITGFEKRGNRGPFECGNCTYFENGDACTQETMKEKSKQPRHPNGDVVVDADDCCEFIERKGRK